MSDLTALAICASLVMNVVNAKDAKQAKKALEPTAVQEPPDHILQITTLDMLGHRLEISAAQLESVRKLAVDPSAEYTSTVIVGDNLDTGTLHGNPNPDPVKDAQYKRELIKFDCKKFGGYLKLRADFYWNWRDTDPSASRKLSPVDTPLFDYTPMDDAYKGDVEVACGRLNPPLKDLQPIELNPGLSLDPSFMTRGAETLVYYVRNDDFELSIDPKRESRKAKSKVGELRLNCSKAVYRTYRGWSYSSDNGGGDLMDFSSVGRDQVKYPFEIAKAPPWIQATARVACRSN